MEVYFLPKLLQTYSYTLCGIFMYWKLQRMGHCHERTHTAPGVSQDLLQLILPQREWEKEQKWVPAFTWPVWAQGKAGVNSQLESVPHPLMSADLRSRIANLSTFGSHAASLWLHRCDRFPVESQLLSLSRSTEHIPSEGKTMEDGPNHGFEQQLNCLEAVQKPAKIPALEMSGMSCSAWTAGGGWGLWFMSASRCMYIFHPPYRPELCATVTRD